MSTNRRKLRPLIITMGGDRQEHMRAMFADPRFTTYFEPPVFSPGVTSRSLRQRQEFFRIANECNLLPMEEWKAIQENSENSMYQVHPDRFFECLHGVPVTEGRRGSHTDVKLHYSVELWRKAKGINRGRSVLACMFAHLMALKRMFELDLDFILEDNARAPVDDCAERVWDIIKARDAYEQATGQKIHLWYFGWLGSIPNLRWIYNSHRPKEAFQLNTEHCKDHTIMTFPTTEDIERDLELQQSIPNEEEPVSEFEAKESERKPGGNPVWGNYGYSMSKEGYENLLEVLRSDVGAMLWKGKRARYYSVKPVDKIFPRQIMSCFGQNAVQLCTHPAFFRAPMLPSKIHTQWDPEFCKSTEFQLSRSDLEWNSLWLTRVEQEIVRHRIESGEWLTVRELETLNTAKQELNQ